MSTDGPSVKNNKINDDMVLAAMEKLTPLCRMVFIFYVWNRLSPLAISIHMASRGFRLDVPAVEKLVKRGFRVFHEHLAEAIETRRPGEQRNPLGIASARTHVNQNRASATMDVGLSAIEPAMGTRH